LKGIKKIDAAIVEEDRELAIKEVILRAAPGDTVLIAGKGHEQYQDYGEYSIPFDDFKHARLALRQRLSDGGADS